MYLSVIEDALKDGNTEEVRRLTTEALVYGYTSEEILNNALIPAMDEIGEQFKESEIFIPQVLQISRAMHGGIRVLQNSVNVKGKKAKTIRILIGTVAGDLHDIGKNLVSMFLNANGYEVINLGVDVPSQEFVWGVRLHRPHVLCMSSLLTTTMPAMQETIDKLEREGLRDKLKILVGGGPVTKKFASSIGADSYIEDAKGTADWIFQNVYT